MENVTYSKPGLRPFRGSLWQRILNVALRADAGHRQNHRLRNLDDHMRADIGLAPTQPKRWTPPGMML